MDPAHQPPERDSRAGRPDRPEPVRDPDAESLSGKPLFRFAQLEYPWPLGPPDGRYLVRDPGDASGEPTHVVVLATLGAPERRRLTRRRPPAPPHPAPEPVATGRATVIEVGAPFAQPDPARAWLSRADEPELEAMLGQLNRLLHAFRVVSADPDRHTLAREQALVARLGYGAGEQVADGEWTEARQLTPRGPARRRRRLLEPQERLAAVMGGREETLPCEELALRARGDLEHGRDREAALQLSVALEAACAQLRSASELAGRIEELTQLRAGVEAATAAALQGPLGTGEREAVAHALDRLEAALRARALIDR